MINQSTDFIKQLIVFGVR